MMPRNGTCSICKKSGDIIVKHLPSAGSLCAACNKKRLESGKVNKPYSLKAKTKPSGEATMFEVIWNTRPHVSFITGQQLGTEAKSFFFAHVLPKSTYPEYRLFMENIVLLTYDEHQAWDQRSREDLISNPLWNKMFELELKLKLKYNEEIRKKDL